MRSIEFGSPEMPINTVGNSITFNKKAVIVGGVAIGILIGVSIYRYRKDNERLRNIINKKKSS